MGKNLRKIIEAEFDPKLKELYEHKDFEKILLRIRTPGTRIETNFRVQVDIYEVLDGSLTQNPKDLRHVRYLGYCKIDARQHQLITTEVPEFFEDIADQILYRDVYAKQKS